MKTENEFNIEVRQSGVFSKVMAADMQKILLLAVIAVAFVLAPSVGLAANREPDQVVRDYITAFRDKNKTPMLSCLSEAFFADFKVQYLAKVESYDEQMLKMVLEIYDVDRLERLRSMSGEAMLSTFLDKPASDSYWQSFDSSNLIVEVERVEVSADRATVRSWLYTKASLPAKVETIYSLENRGGQWLIERFQKKVIRP